MGSVKPYLGIWQVCDLKVIDLLKADLLMIKKSHRFSLLTSSLNLLLSHYMQLNSYTQA